ncbi:MAG: tol-pal system-associated acyl-CoA thioesterase [Gammaproteobacteria bacterium]|nr:tol-pal system-associated acyl-CoA thioesterase [Gammaproteobacteria bacterium]
MAEFHWQVRVYYEDTDSGGVVYYANYLRFLERARTEWMRALGFEQDELSRDDGLLFAVRSASVDYLRPACFNDLLTVSVRVVERRRASLVFEQRVHRPDDAQGPLCSAIIRIACLDAESLAPRPIPEKILREIPDVD